MMNTQNYKILLTATKDNHAISVAINTKNNKYALILQKHNSESVLCVKEFETKPDEKTIKTFINKYCQ